jgi:DNA-binding ferritin-like protein (Dps family)
MKKKINSRNINAGRTLKAIHKNLVDLNFENLIRISRIKQNPEIKNSLQNLPKKYRREIYEIIKPIIYDLYRQNITKRVAQIYTQILKLIGEEK